MLDPTIASLARRRRSGFTLLEALVVVALLALTASAALPSFRFWLLRDRVDQATRDLLDSFAYARTQAQRTGRKVTLCRVDSRHQCANTSVLCGQGSQARGDNWACGWLVTVAMPAAADARVDAIERRADMRMARTSSAPSSRILREYGANRAVTVTSPPAALSFTPPVGQVIGSFRDFQITPAVWAADAAEAASAPQLARCIRLAAGGRARVSEGLC